MLVQSKNILRLIRKKKKVGIETFPNLAVMFFKIVSSGKMDSKSIISAHCLLCVGNIDSIFINVSMSDNQYDKLAIIFCATHRGCMSNFIIDWQVIESGFEQTYYAILEKKYALINGIAL